VDYKVWSVMQEKDYQHRNNDVGESCEHTVSALDDPDQRIIDILTRQSGSGKLVFMLESRQTAL